MKTSKIIIASVWIAVAALVWSCDDNPGIEPETPTDQSVLAENILIGSNSALNRVRGTGLGGPIGAIFGTFNNNGGRASTPLSMRNQAMHAGRTQTDSTDVTPDCLIETWEDDGQGNFTYTLDFGDGCDYYGEFLKGKMVEKGSYTDNSFSSSVTYTNFGGEDWTIDGTYSYSGTWEDTTDADANTEEDSVWSYNASYQFEADLTQEWIDYGYHDSTEVSTGETLISVDYVASGSESMDENGYTVESRTESVTMSTGESFNSSVDSPLFYDYTCEEDDVWVFTKGIESGSYVYGDESGSYSIDYGDGTCDNIILLTENGVTEEIDLGEIWDDWEEECDGDDHDEDETD